MILFIRYVDIEYNEKNLQKKGSKSDYRGNCGIWKE